MDKNNKQFKIDSNCLERVVIVDLIDFEQDISSQTELLIMNDGQDINRLLPYTAIRSLIHDGIISPVLIIAIHSGERRAKEYGISNEPDYKGRGDLAAAYEKFVVNELLPWVQTCTGVSHRPFKTAFAGCSLGGLSALDIAISNPGSFGKAGVFSGSLWWRNKSYEDGYTQDDRLIFKKIRNYNIDPVFKCWLMAGSNDEQHDRNRNGVIDSVDDTLDLFDLLSETIPGNVHLSIVPNGRHDIETWRSKFPEFMTSTFSRI